VEATPSLIVNERVCASALSTSVGWLRKDRLGAKVLPFYRIGKLVRYDLERCRAALLAIEEGGPKAARK